MRILYATDDPIRAGGAVREHISAICRGFREAGHHISLVCPSTAVASDELWVDQVYCYGEGASLPRVTRMFKTYRTVLKQPFDVVYMRYRASQLPLLFMRKFYRIPLFIEVNGIPEFEMTVSPGKRALIRTTQKLFERSFFGRAQGLIAVTPEIAAHCIERLHMKARNVRVLNNGVWPERYQVKPAKGYTKPVRLGFVGNIAWWQGLEPAVRAIGVPALENEVELIIVGGGPMLDNLRNLANSLGVSNIHFTGPVPAKSVPSMMQTFDIGLASKSITGEGLSPLKLYEYWATGIAVLATDLPGLDIVLKVDGGRVYAIDDPESLRTTVLEMIAMRDQWSKWGQNGRRYVEEHASWRRIGAQTVEFILEQLGTGR